MNLITAIYGYAENVVIVFWWTTAMLAVLCGPFLAVIYYGWLSWRAERSDRRLTTETDARELERLKSGYVLAARVRRDFTPAFLVGWKVPLAGLLAVAAAIGIQIDWWFAVYPLAASVFVASWWYGDLRREGVAGSEVYALALWALPHVVLSLALAAFDEPTRPLVWQTALLSCASLALAYGMTRAGVVRGLQTAIASLALLNLLTLYLSSRYAIPLTTGAIVVIGYTFARELRLMASGKCAWRADGAPMLGEDPSDAALLSPTEGHSALPSGSWQVAGAVLTVGLSAFALVSGAAWLLADAAERDGGNFPHFPWIAGLVLGCALIPLTLVIYRRGTIAKWGAMLLALAWVAVNDALFGYPTITEQWQDWLTFYGVREFASVGVVGVAILLVMWRAFGPGAYRPAKSSGAVTGPEPRPPAHLHSLSSTDV